MGLENMTLNDVHGEIPSIKFYQTQKELETIVGEFVKRCVAEGLQSNDIVILTAKTAEASWLASNSKYSGIETASEKEPGKILFTTIRKFKGLEAKAILIVDTSLSALLKAESRRLLYVGCSRAKNLLSIAMLDDVENTDMGDFLRNVAPGRNVPKNKKGLKRLLNVTI